MTGGIAATRQGARLATRVFRAALLAGLAGGLLVGCDGLGNRYFNDNVDPAGKLSRADFEKLRDRAPPPALAPAPPIPALQPVLTNPQPPLGGADRLVSLTVTDSVPLKDVLIELARRADVDLQMDPRISGGIVFTAREQPFSVVLERISDLAGLRYSIRDGFLRIELDEPFHTSYRLDVLNLRRNTTSNVSISTNVFAAVGGGSGGGGNNSTSSVSAESNSDPWEEIQRNLTQIMANSARARALGAPTPAPEASASAAPGTPNAAPQGAVSAIPGLPSIASPLAAVASALGAATPSAAPTTTTTTTAASAQRPGAATTTTSTTTPAAAGQPQSQAAGATALASALNTASAEVPSFSISRQTGVVSVYGTKKQQDQVSQYLNRLKRQSGAQVLIEGRIIEVTLNEEFRAGIDWRTLFRQNLNAGANFAPGNPNNTFAIAPSLSPATPFASNAVVPTGVLTLGLNAADIGAVLQLVETFGTVRSLSSPRLTVLNNQTAILKVAQNQVYFTSTVTPGTAATATTAAIQTSVSSTPQTVPVGLVMAVQPVIDFDTGTITMTLRPTISRIVGNVNDPGVAIASQQVVGAGGTPIVSAIPVVEVREIDSVLKMQTGSIAIMGGLMRDTSENTDAGVPGVNQIPLIGNLFKSRTRASSVVELVILLRATIVENSVPDQADGDLYRTYTRDPRPFAVQPRTP